MTDPSLWMLATGVPLPVVIGVGSFFGVAALVGLGIMLAGNAKLSRLNQVPRLRPSELLHAPPADGTLVSIAGNAVGPSLIAPNSKRACVAWHAITLSVSRDPEQPTTSHGRTTSLEEWGICDPSATVRINPHGPCSEWILDPVFSQALGGHAGGDYSWEDKLYERIVVSGQPLNVVGLVTRGAHGVTLSLDHKDAGVFKPEHDTRAVVAKEIRLGRVITLISIALAAVVVTAMLVSG